MKPTIVALISLALLAGCGKLGFAPEPSKTNAYESASTTRRQIEARIWWEASRKDFASDVEAKDWFDARWKKGQDEAFSKINAAEQKVLGDGKFDSARAKALWKKLALMADPSVEKIEPLDDLGLDDEGDGL
jgi:hypothetical protein